MGHRVIPWFKSEWAHYPYILFPGFSDTNAANLDFREVAREGWYALSGLFIGV